MKDSYVNYPLISLIFRWEKQVGDTVAVDEVVCEVETDKTSVPVTYYYL